VTYGVGRADVHGADVRVGDDLTTRFVLESEWGTAEVALSVRGEHQVTNALAAAAVGLVAGVDVDEVASGLAAAELSPWRMELLTTTSGALVINDSYNANPVSTEAALHALARLDRPRMTAVLGPMAELGHLSVSEHERIAALAVSLDLRLVAVAASEYGETVEHVADLDGALEVLGDLDESDAVLVKGSRVAGLERFAAMVHARH
jgi:UDP-N-acetylmuramoyl-tripeptide--D-alanyl-D-alanine ligase